MEKALYKCTTLLYFFYLQRKHNFILHNISQLFFDFNLVGFVNLQQTTFQFPLESCFFNFSSTELHTFAPVYLMLNFPQFGQGLDKTPVYRFNFLVMYDIYAFQLRWQSITTPRYLTLFSYFRTLFKV